MKKSIKVFYTVIAAFIVLIIFNVQTYAEIIGPPPGAVDVAGALDPPANATDAAGNPVPTMKTLDEIPPAWNKILPTAANRFELVMDGAAVLDKETGLVWEASPNTVAKVWSNATSHCYQRIVGNRMGWRLPTIEELTSLVDFPQSNTSLPLGYDIFFSTVQQFVGYWSMTSHSSASAWFLRFNDFFMDASNKSAFAIAWCVRGGHGYDGY